MNHYVIFDSYSKKKMVNLDFFYWLLFYFQKSMQENTTSLSAENTME